MADFTALKTAIQNAIKQNGNEDITGNILQDVLLAIVSTLGDGSINDLITALGSEATTRSQADGTLQQNIEAEATTRGNADSTLQQNIEAEATTRGNADSTLQQNIEAEATTRGNADTALGGRIDGVIESINAINAAIGSGYVYAGIATPSSTPTTGKVFYLALTAGTYTNFGNIAVTQGINILKYNGSTWSLDAFIGIDDAPAPSSQKLVKSGGVFDEVMKNGSAFDLSAYNGGATYADLNAALTALNALPAAYKRGGMSMKFVLSSDKYVQHRLMSSEWSINEEYWQGVDEEPTAGSKNLLESGGAHNRFAAINSDVSGIKDLLVYNEVSQEESIIDYRPAGTAVISGGYFACLHSNSLPDREQDGILKQIKLLAAPSVDTSFSIKLYKKVWVNGVITGFTAVQDGEYSLTCPAGVSSFNVSANNIVVPKDAIIAINGLANYYNSGDNYCILNGAYYPSLEGNFSISVDYIIELLKPESARLNNIEVALIPISILTQLKNANIVVMGDSITWLGGDDCNGRSGYEGKGWTQYFKAILNPASMRSYARSGATWSHTSSTQYDIVESTVSLSDDNVIYNQINRLLADNVNPAPDLIIIAAGTNDAWYLVNARPDALSVTAETEFADTESYITSEPVNTLTSIAAAMRYDIELLKQNYPNCQIIVTTPLQSTKFPLSRCFAVGKVIRECAEYLSIECIDQGKDAGIYRAQENEGFLFTYDGAHTSVIGGRMVGQFILQKALSLYRGKLV